VSQKVNDVLILGQCQSEVIWDRLRKDKDLTLIFCNFYSLALLFKSSFIWILNADQLNKIINDHFFTINDWK